MYNTNLLDCTSTEVAVDVRTLTTRFVVYSLSAIAITLILSVAARAATTSVMPCEQVSRDLRSLKVPVTALTLDTVDHVPIDQEAGDPNSFSAERLSSDFEAPVLFLTPRVTNILRDVFGVTTEAQAPSEPEHKSSSPLADSEEQAESGLAVATDEVNESIDLPHYQRQMYRTDI
jgi:hypothetical protein